MIPLAVQRTVLLLSFATFSSMTAQRICDAMLPELAREFAVSLGQAAQVVSLFAAVYGAAQLAHGPLGEHFGKFRLVTWVTLVCSVGSVLCMLAPSINALVLARMVVAAAAAAIIPMSMAWVGDSVEPHQLQETLARLGLGSTFGIVGGQLTGGMLTDALGWRWAFAFMALLFAVVGGLLYRQMHAQRSQALAYPLQEVVAHNAPSGLSAKNAPFFLQLREILGQNWPRLVLAVALAEGAAGFGVLAMWASHLHRTHGLSLTVSGWVVGLFGLGGVGYMLVARPLIHRFGQAGLARLGACLVAAGAMVMAYAWWWWLAMPASVLAGFGFFMFHNTLQANAAQMVPHARGIGVSLFASFLFLGQSLGVMLAASLIGWIGTAPVIGLGGLGMLILGAIFASALGGKAAGSRKVIQSREGRPL